MSKHKHRDIFKTTLEVNVTNQGYYNTFIRTCLKELFSAGGSTICFSKEHIKDIQEACSKKNIEIKITDKEDYYLISREIISTKRKYEKKDKYI